MIDYRTAILTDIDDLISLRMVFLKEVESVYNPKYESEVNSSFSKYLQETIPAESYVSWLAVKDGKIVATSGLSFNTVPPSYGNHTGKEAYIMNMYTIPEYRRKGIARNLFVKTLEEAKKRGVGKIRLHATEKGRPLYLKYGFEERGDEMVLFLSK
jgi:GNAT superfamily N-acetyltransferase